jgi:hypothetical protein
MEMNSMESLKRKFANLQTQSLLLSLILLLVLSGCCWFVEKELGKQEKESGTEKADSTYSLREIEYFLEIALGAEYGTSEIVKRWKDTIAYQMKGTPTTRDRIEVKSVMRELTELTGKRVKFTQVTSDPDMTIWFVPVKDMSKYEPEYVEGNWGFFYLWWNGNKEIYRANVLIGSDEPNQTQRNHLIREEVTQSLGLINDSWKYEESIFYQGWTEVQEYAEIDEKLIYMLYSDEIKPGMTRKEAMDALMKTEAQ